MSFQYSFTRVSGNTKTGPIPVSMTSSNSCPNNCIFKGSGCYAESGRPRIWWSRLDSGEWGISFGELIKSIKSLPVGQLWRMNQAGDIQPLDDDNSRIDAEALRKISAANKGKNGFTYTHHVVLGDSLSARHNARAVREANDKGFTVNLSADTPAEADRMKALNIGPVCVTLPGDIPAENNRSIKTPAGNTIVQCPATYRDDIQCINCKVCAVETRKVIIGFPVHGAGKAKARKVINIKQSNE